MNKPTEVNVILRTINNKPITVVSREKNHWAVLINYLQIGPEYTSKILADNIASTFVNKTA